MIEITFNDDKLQDKLKTLEPKVARKVLRKAMRPSMKRVLNYAKSRCPVDSGDLRKSMGLRASKRSRKSFGLEIKFNGTTMFKSLQYYSGMIEFGTEKMPPIPFVRPAYDTQGEAALIDCTERCWKLIQEEAKK